MLSAASNFGLIFAATRTLSSPSEQSEFLAFWSMLIGVFGICTGIQNESARAASSLRVGRPPGTRLIAAALPLGLLLAGVIMVGWPVLSRYVLPLSGSFAVPLLAISTAIYAAYTTMVGAAAGRAWWSGYVGALATELGLRLVLAVGVAVIGATLFRFEFISAAAMVGSFAVFLLFASARRALLSASDADLRTTISRMAMAMVSMAATATIVTAYPALVKASSGSDAPTLVAAMMVAVSVTRAPIMMPLTTFQGLAVSVFTEHRDHPFRALAKPLAGLLALGVLSGLGFALLGPWLLRLFNPDYHVSWTILALLSLSSTAMGALMLLGSLALSLDQHRWYAAGWIVAATASIMLLLTPLRIEYRVLLSLSVGPLLGAGLLLVPLVASARTLTVRPTGNAD